MAWRVDRKVLLWSLVGLAWTATACESAEFGAGSSRGQKMNQDDANQYDENGNLINTPDADAKGDSDTYPIIKSPEDQGWVGKQAWPEIQKILNIPETANGDPGSPDGDGGSGTQEPGSVSDAGDGVKLPSFGENEDGVFWVPCQQSGTESLNAKLRRKGEARIRIAGELCPDHKERPKLTVLFVVDFSASMQVSMSEGPNDPMVGGSCGRLRAASAMIEKFGGGDFRGYDINLGMVGFSSTASIRVPFANLAQAKGTLNAATWCGSDSNMALTNYKAAFDLAHQELLQISGDKVVYFISDGSPTLGGEPGQSHNAAGLAAAQRLRSMADAPVMNTVYLLYQKGGAKDPKGYLDQVTGDPARVRVVGSADELVGAIGTLDTSAVVIAKNAVSARLQALSKERNINISRVTKSSSLAGRWVYMTDAFVLVGVDNTAVLNELIVKAVPTSGKELGSRAAITYTRLP